MTEKPEVLTSTEITFDKNDVAIVAIAKIEEEIRKNIKQSKEKINVIDKEIDKIGREYIRDGKNKWPKEIEDKEKFFVDMIKKGKMEDELDVKKSHSVSFHKDSENTYNLSLAKMVKDTGKVQSLIQIISVQKKLTKRQLEIIDEHKKLQDEREAQVKLGVEWKKKLQDIPAAERQMKAVIIENELNKSPEGKALVDLLKNNYMARIKAIEM